ncbi:chalcone synthase B [Podospora appendiculata]|uniref:Chalcone synthase B n=1 Tax=Podospora appendiculata TaxID=314037 RepID=A0AAE0XFA5_9PEZI|nr:chalcone synthase B [Podospora appendiculata]
MGSQAPAISPIPGLWITGLASQYPPHLLGPERMDEIAARFDHDLESPGLKKLLQVNRHTGIKTRAMVSTYEDGFGTGPEPPSIADIDAYFRQAGVDLAAQACRKALRESGCGPEDITHTVAVTCTTEGNPGYDLLVARQLHLPHTIDRTLLHGVGCAGGLSILRAAAQLALAATARQRPARVLCFACELCSPNIRREMREAERCPNPADICIGGALFSDAAAAFVLCNEYAMAAVSSDKNSNNDSGALFQLLEWGSATIPDTEDELGWYAEPLGRRAVLSRNVPRYTKKAIRPMFEQLLPSYHAKTSTTTDLLQPADFDWALHPGGEAIIEGARRVLDLTGEQLRATREIYETCGNSSSPTVLAVLDELRRTGRGRDHVVVTSFGPGLMVEMAMLRRCRGEGGEEAETA